MNLTMKNILQYLAEVVLIVAGINLIRTAYHPGGGILLGMLMTLVGIIFISAGSNRAGPRWSLFSDNNKVEDAKD